MFFKSIILNIFCSKIPCKLTILSCDNKIIKNFFINSYYTKLCIRTKDCAIKLLATNKNQTIYQKLYLNCKFCQKYCVNFAFFTILPQKLFNYIKLTDKIYGFPISKAILNFQLSS